MKNYGFSIDLTDSLETYEGGEETLALQKAGLCYGSVKIVTRAAIWKKQCGIQICKMTEQWVKNFLDQRFAF